MVGTAVVGVTVSAKSALSVTANTQSADQVSGTYQFLQPGWITLVSKGSATGLNVTMLIGGVAVINNQNIVFTGTAGTISTKDNIVFHIYTKGGRAELFFTNTTGGNLTVDELLLWSPNP